MIHNHPNMEMKKDVDNDHVIVDRKDFTEALKQQAPRIRVLEKDEILVVSSPNELTYEAASEFLKKASKSKRFIVIHGYDLYVMQKKEQITVEKKVADFKTEVGKAEIELPTEKADEMLE